MTTTQLATIALPALPNQFHTAALAMPQRVREILPALTTMLQASDSLAKAEAMSQYARHLKIDTESINAIQEAKLLLQAKIGQLIAPESPQKTGANGGRGNKAPKGGALGAPPLGKHTKSTYRKISTHAEKIEEYAEKVAEANQVLEDDSLDAVEMSSAGFLRFIGSDGNIKAHQNRGVIEWYTPEKYIEAARNAMGTIDLDPASCGKANKVVKAETFFSKDDDGLSKEWSGNVWLNPPFKADLIKPFIHKLCESYEEKTVRQAILLTNNNTDTAWWHEAAESSSLICFTKGRIAFYNPAGESASPTNGHTLFYFGNRQAVFRDNFQDFGVMMKKLDS